MATEFEKLKDYLDKMGLTYEVKDANGRNKIPYTDKDGKDSEVNYTKVITIDSPESAKKHYPKVDLWYIQSLDRLVDAASPTDGETDNLQADTAKDILDYIGYVYWELDNAVEELTSTKRESRKCSMLKKKESLLKKKNESSLEDRVQEYDEYKNAVLSGLKDKYTFNIKTIENDKSLRNYYKDLHSIIDGQFYSGKSVQDCIDKIAKWYSLGLKR